MRVEFQAGTDDDDRRLETVLRRLCPLQSLGAVHKALRRGDIRLNGVKTGPEARVRTGDVIAVWDALLRGDPLLPVAKPVAPLPAEWLLWDGPDLVVVNKPSGVLVHRGEESSFDTPLDERVRAWLAGSGEASLGFRPGPLHRLDRETSGIVVFSRTLVGAREFSAALADRRVKKTYLAVLTGTLESARQSLAKLARHGATRTSALDPDGESADTAFRPLAHASGLTLVEVHLGTGRTHQIRVHAQALGHPLAGDRKYGGGATPVGLDVPWLLHAWKLDTHLLPLQTAPLPPPRVRWVEKTFKILL